MNHDEYMKKLEDPGNRNIVLLITESCNLNCKYCYESYKSTKKMSVSTCKEILTREFIASAADGVTTKLSITFLGGEPLLNFSLIKEISEWLWNQNQLLPYTLDLRTNGTLLTKEMKQWFLENKHRIDLSLSLDGLNETQKINRTDKYIDYKFFTDNWPHRKVKIVLFKDSLDLFADTVIEMLQNNIAIEVDVGCGFEWNTSDAIIFEEQLNRLLPLYEDDICGGRETGLFPFSVENFFKIDFFHYTFCLKYSNKVSYTSEGKRYGCHMFTPLVIGAKKAEWICSHSKEIDQLPVDKRCIACPLFDSCKSCAALNLKVTGDVTLHAPLYTNCKMMKVQARACAMLFLRHIQKNIQKNIKLSEFIQICAEKSIRLLRTIPEAKYL